MENKKEKTLVLQVTGDTALLLCQGGRLLRAKNTKGYSVGDEIEEREIEEITQKRVNEGRYLIKGIIKAAVFIIIVGAFATMLIPIHTEPLMNCIEVRTNLYGRIISVRDLNENGKDILEFMDNNKDSSDFKTGSISEYQESIEKVLAIMNIADIDNLSEIKKDFREDNNIIEDNEIFEGVLEEEQHSIINQDNKESNNTLDEKGTEQLTMDSYEIPDQELQLARELFGYEKVRQEYYSMGYEGHETVESNTEHAADIYIPFWGINMEAYEWMPANTITLSFDFPAIEEIPNFNEASIYLYDLTTQKDVESGIVDKISGNYEDASGVKLASAYQTLYVDCSRMEPYQTYYIKINNVILNDNEIKNIHYVFDYVPGGSIGFRVED